MMRKHLWARRSSKWRRRVVKGRWESVKGRIKYVKYSWRCIKGRCRGIADALIGDGKALKGNRGDKGRRGGIKRRQLKVHTSK